MKRVTSVSGGKTSAYIAANYPSDYLLFALVRSDDPSIKFKDRALAQRVEDRIQKPFIATLEDDIIIHTIFDLEQYIGKEITWVSDITFDELIKEKGGYLPNKMTRICTENLKIRPMFYWWSETIGTPVEMAIGFRANERNRIKKQQDKLNKNGLISFKATFDTWKSGRHKGMNKWEMIEWQKPIYPLFEDGIYKEDVENYWGDKPVRFAALNNCVGCFHRNPMLLRKMADIHPDKLKWFANKEGNGNGYWRSDTTYEKIINHPMQIELSFDDFSGCDSGYCGF